MELTAELVVTVVAAALALAFDLVPGLKQRWEALDREVKRFSWLLGCLVVGLVPWALACVGVTSLFTVACTAEGLVGALQVAFSAYFAGQFTHGVSGVVSRSVKGQGTESE
jgi:multisubunit Na+/H+ antiporter MnhB subunit